MFFTEGFFLGALQGTETRTCLCLFGFLFLVLCDKFAGAFFDRCFLHEFILVTVINIVVLVLSSNQFSSATQLRYSKLRLTISILEKCLDG